MLQVLCQLIIRVYNKGLEARDAGCGFMAEGFRVRSLIYSV